MKSELMIHRVLETGHERLLSPDEVSQSSLDSLRPVLAEALETNLPVPIRGRFWMRGEFWIQAQVDQGKMHARVWHGDEASRVVLIEMTVARTSEEERPLLEVSRAGTLATNVADEVGLELGGLVARIAWCWLLTCDR